MAGKSSSSPEAAPNKLKDLFSIQLEASKQRLATVYLFMWAFPLSQVTERLLESEEHKLKLLKTEIEVFKHKNKDRIASQNKVTAVKQIT